MRGLRASSILRRLLDSQHPIFCRSRYPTAPLPAAPSEHQDFHRSFRKFFFFNLSSYFPICWKYRPDKAWKYRADYNNMNPPNTVSFMPAIASTSGRLHIEFVRLLFLQVHRETDPFFASSGVQLQQTDRGMFHYLHSVFSVQFKIKVGLTLTKTATLRIT